MFFFIISKLLIPISNCLSIRPNEGLYLLIDLKIWTDLVFTSFMKISVSAWCNSNAAVYKNMIWEEHQLQRGPFELWCTSWEVHQMCQTLWKQHFVLIVLIKTVLVWVQLMLILCDSLNIPNYWSHKQTIRILLEKYCLKSHNFFSHSLNFNDYFQSQTGPAIIKF